MSSTQPQTLADIVNEAMHRTGHTSANSFAKSIGVTHPTVGTWLRNERCPDFETVGELAKMAGCADPIATAARIRMQFPEGAKHRGFLRQLAAAAAALVAAVGLAIMSPAKALPYQQVSESAQMTCYALCVLLRRVLRRFFGAREFAPA